MTIGRKLGGVRGDLAGLVLALFCFLLEIVEGPEGVIPEALEFGVFLGGVIVGEVVWIDIGKLGVVVTDAVVIALDPRDPEAGV